MEVQHLWKRGCPDVEERGASTGGLTECCQHVEEGA